MIISPIALYAADSLLNQPITIERHGTAAAPSFLRELEAVGLIQSAEHILDQAAAQRNVERQRAANEDGVTRDRLHDQLARRRGGTQTEP